MVLYTKQKTKKLACLVSEILKSICFSFWFKDFAFVFTKIAKYNLNYFDKFYFSKKWFKFKLEEFEENIVKKMLYFRMMAIICTF